MTSTLHRRQSQRLTVVHICLALFFVVSFGRPEDWIPGLSAVPLAKIAAALALFAFVFAFRDIRWPLPREAVYLILLTIQLFATVPMSPVWPGGAFQKSLEFSKVAFIVVLIVSVVTTLKRLRRLILIQAASVAAVAGVTVLQGHFKYQRLQSVIGGDYADPNSLALAIVVSLPLCLALMFLSRNLLAKAVWALATLLMIYAIFLTGSRGGFVALLVAVVYCLWEFSIQGRRRYLLPIAALTGIIIWYFASGMLAGRLESTFSLNKQAESAYSSSQQRQQLFWRSIEVTEQHPLFGVGPGNFQMISGNWHVTHNSLTEMSAEGGLPAFILYGMILWSGFKNVRTVKRLAHGRKRMSLMAKALRASLAGYLVGALFISTAYEYFPYFLVAYTTALAWVARRTAATPKMAAAPLLAAEDKREAYAGSEAQSFALNG